MTCIRCKQRSVQKFGTYGRRKIQRWRCQECKATFSTPKPKIGKRPCARLRSSRSRTDGRYQVTSDQYNAYVGAMREHFGQNVDFGQLRKIYSSGTGDGWYGSGQVVGAVPHVKIGRPDFSRISTSHVERTNLSVRMHLRRYARRTNALSKKLENHKACFALWVTWYNFVRVNMAVRMTPAMASGLTDSIWTMRDLLRTLN